MKCSNLHFKKNKTIKFEPTRDWLEPFLESLQRIHLNRSGVKKNSRFNFFYVSRNAICYFGNFTRTATYNFLILKYEKFRLIWKEKVISRKAFGNTDTDSKNWTLRFLVDDRYKIWTLALTLKYIKTHLLYKTWLNM